MNTFQVARPSPINRVQKPLTPEAVRAIAPSAFAPAPHESRSSRFAYIPHQRSDLCPYARGLSTLLRSPEQNPRRRQARFHEAPDPLSPRLDRYRPPSRRRRSRSCCHELPRWVKLLLADGSHVSSHLPERRCSFLQPGGQTLKVNHTGKIIDQVIEGSYSVIDRSVKAIDVVEGLNRLQLTSGDQQAFAAAAHSLRFANSEGEVATPITPAQLLAPRRREDAGSDLWRTLERRSGERHQRGTPTPPSAPSTNAGESFAATWPPAKSTASTETCDSTARSGCSPRELPSSRHPPPSCNCRVS